MTYTFKLTITKNESKLALLGDDREVAAKEWGESRDMGRQLFQAIDELLAEQGIRPEEVAGFEIDSDMPDGYTSMRIAETVKRTYMFAAELKSAGGKLELEA
jgi:hypothetical protein